MRRSSFASVVVACTFTCMHVKSSVCVHIHVKYSIHVDVIQYSYIVFATHDSTLWIGYSHIIGASLGEPHTSITSLCVGLLDACLLGLTNYWIHIAIYCTVWSGSPTVSWIRLVLDLHCTGVQISNPKPSQSVQQLTYHCASLCVKGGVGLVWLLVVV